MNLHGVLRRVAASGEKAGFQAFQGERCQRGLVIPTGSRTEREADSASGGIYGCDADGADSVRSVRRLECVECGRVSRENERGWTARFTVDDEVAVYCSDCNEREFYGS